MCSRSVRTRPASCTCCRGVAASTGSRRLPKPPDAERHLNGNRPLEVAMQTRIRSLALAALAGVLLVTGTAEGMVNGERRSLKLEFAETAREGVHALKRTWPKEGTWTLVIQANQGPDDAATAVVDLGPDGEVATIRVP